MSSYEILFSIHAIDDIEETILYYNKKQAKLGFRFLNQVEATFKKIADNPYIYSVRYEKIRCAKIWKFPFLIHFHTDNHKKQVEILAVFSTYQKPLWE